MEREQFKVLVKAMKAVYAQPTFIPDQDAFNVWFALLGDLPYKQAELAVQKHMATEKFPPTIADIREKAEQITSVKETEMSELEAWAIVRKAIGRSNYYAEEEFEKLPEACKMAVGNPSNLREWAMMDSDQVGTVEQEGYDGCRWEDVNIDCESETLKELALYPGEPEAYCYIDSTEGEYLPRCGGGWGNTSGAGVFSVNLYYPRTNADGNIGFRSAYFRKLKTE